MHICAPLLDPLLDPLLPLLDVLPDEWPLLDPLLPVASGPPSSPVMFESPLLAHAMTMARPSDQTNSERNDLLRLSGMGMPRLDASIRER
jgi:hypothetical protein